MLRCTQSNSLNLSSNSNLPEYKATTLPIENSTPSSLAGDPEATAEIKSLKTAFENLELITFTQYTDTYSDRIMEKVDFILHYFLRIL